MILSGTILLAFMHFDFKRNFMKKYLFLEILFSFLFFSCNFFSQNGFFIEEGINQTIESSQNISQDERLWTILIYMCADNNLESAAMDDVFEMECSTLDTNIVNILLLIDKSESYTNLNDNWSGTKLFKLKTDRNQSQFSMISQELDCSYLGLISGEKKELDLSDESVLEKSILYAMNRFPASNYGLIMWGHGSGWKNLSENDKSYKGFSYDETSKSYMTLKQFGSALKNCFSEQKLDFLGFDTCYGGEIEVMYEIRNFVKFACGSEGLISSSGWNYENLFSTFQKSELKTVEDLLEASFLQFKKQYSTTNRASFSVCDLSKIEDYFTSFDLFTKKSADLITNPTLRDSVFEILYASENCNTEKYTLGTEGYDVYFDCISLCKNLNDFFQNQELNFLYEKFIQAHNLCIVKSWASDRNNAGLGVFFQTLATGGFLQTSYNSNYIKGKTYNQIDFVSENTGYVPTLSKNQSLLDKIFYSSF